MNNARLGIQVVISADDVYGKRDWIEEVGILSGAAYSARGHLPSRGNCNVKYCIRCWIIEQYPSRHSREGRSVKLRPKPV